MQQIRFDFLGGVSGNNSRTGNANANPAETGDAFAQILDQQLARRADAGTDRRAAEPRERSDASDRTDGRHPQAAKRREAKPSASTTTSNKPETTNAKPAAKTKQPETKASEGETCGKPATKPDETDATAEAAAGGQTAAESKSSSTTTETETEGHPDTPARSATAERRVAATGRRRH